MSIVSALLATTGTTASLNLSVTPGSAYGSHFGPGTAGTNTVTVSVSGGTPPYSHSWAKFSGDTFTVTIPSAATTSFTANVGYGEVKTAIYRDTVSDSAGRSFTIDVEVSVEEQSFA